MATYALFIEQDTGNWHNGLLYNENDMPPEEAIPLGCALITFNESTTNFNILSAMLLGGNSALADLYLRPMEGGLKYNFTTSLFEFTEAPVPSLVDAVRIVRNNALKACDHLALCTDMPAELMAQTIAYRQALRDLTSTMTPEMTMIEHLPWPEIPSHH